MNTRDDSSPTRTSDPTRPHDPERSSHEDPWPVDVTGHDERPCDCPPRPPETPKPPCTRSTPKRDDCCDRLLERLESEPGRRTRRTTHKPKTPSKVKLANWCCDWPVRDSLAPLTALLFRRFKKGLTAKNEFEKGIYEFLRAIDDRHRDGLERAFEAYGGIPDARRCGFETRFDEWSDDQPVDPEFVTKVLLQEIVKLGRYGVFDKTSGPGAMRLWKRAVGPLINETEQAVLTGPWPWICAVNPGADDVKWFRNHDAVIPDPAVTVKYDLHEFSVTCSASADPNNPKAITVDCKDNVPAPGGFAICEGGDKYNFSESGTGKFRCIAIPQCVAGQGVGLRGFNFTSLDCKVVIRKLGGGFKEMEVSGDVMADKEPPSKEASCSVRDVLTFTIPRTVRDGVNDIPVPPGRYEIEVHVPNDAHYAPTPGNAPAEFVSNTALIDIIPPLDITYQIWVERGNCYEETDGPGGDEPWFRSYTATYQAVGSQVLGAMEADIFRQEDVDSGEAISFAPVTPFQGSLQVSGCVGIAILGLEVDDDEAAEEQVTAFGEAYSLYWKQILTVLSTGTAGGLLGKGIAAAIGGAGITASLIVGGIGLIVIAALGLLFAAWAPADPIAYDIMVYDMVTLNKLTTPGGTLPLGDAGGIGYITWSRLPKSITPTSATTADYREERQYRAPDEGSKYGLDFKINRL